MTRKRTTTMTVSIIPKQLKIWDANFTVGNFSGKPGFYHTNYMGFMYRQKSVADLEGDPREPRIPPFGWTKY